MKKLNLYPKLTWHDVLDSYKPNSKWWGSIDKFLPVVIDLGYEYFAWNERIYSVERYVDTPSGFSYQDTDLTVYDIKEAK
jgi:hypothetical protein